MLDRTRWEHLHDELGISVDAEMLTQLTRMYDEEHRHYHDSSHIVACLGHLDRTRHLAERPAEVELALWFHDAVYDTRADDNEEKSAALAAEYLRARGEKGDSVRRIGEMILATKTHTPSTPDEALMVDLDLSVLGSPSADFERYDRAIRREYSWVPEARYREARADVLQGFLDRPAIFRVSQIHEERESRARANLVRKVDELRA